MIGLLPLVIGSQALTANVIVQYEGANAPVVIKTESAEAARVMTRALESNPKVKWAWQDRHVAYVREAFVPNDPYYFAGSGWPGQWILNEIQTSGAWNRDLTGQGVIVGFVDDGFEFLHADLQPGYSASNSYDFGQNDTNAYPVSTLDNHGTALLGIACARGGNNQGITGVAPFAVWGGIRVDFDSASLASQFTSATSHRAGIIKIKNHSYGFNAPWVDASAQTAAQESSTSLGTIHVRSAGNGRGTTAEDCNKQMEKASPAAIVASNTSTYSAFGANVFVTLPHEAQPIITTDRGAETFGFNGAGDTFPDANYSSIYSGTSASAAYLTGALALAKHAQPNLDTRFAKHLLARTSGQILNSDPEWVTNGAGLKFNPKFGFGQLNVDALTAMATQWDGASALTTTAIGPVTVGATVPDNNASGVSRTFTVTDTTPLEEVIVTLNATHAYRGDLSGTLTSPSGTVSKLFSSHPADSGANISWKFTSNAFWGENPSGTWTLTIADVAAPDTGSWVNYSVTLRHGQLQRTLTGTVDLQDFVGSVAGRTVDLTIGSRAVTVTLESGGNFTTPLFESVPVVVRAKASHWLTRQVNLTTNSLLVSLVNGDVDGDDEVGPGDFAELSSRFGASLGDSGYTDAADLDGDEEVGPNDFSILATHFGDTGD